MTLKFFIILTQKNRENVLEYVAPEFAKLYTVLRGVQVAEVTSAVPLTPALRAEMERLVTKQTGLTSVTLTEKVDAELIGGFVLRIGDQQLDDSVRTNLRRLRTSLQETTYQNQM